jgi:diketogulonate reductase-like aldo/keto reductase
VCVCVTRQDLGVAYLDLYLMHWPLAFGAKPDGSAGVVVRSDVSILDTWRAMEVRSHPAVRALGWGETDGPR